MNSLLTKKSLAKFRLTTLLILGAPSLALSQAMLSLEGDLTWQSKNNVRIPGNTGTLFSLTDLGKGPTPAFRVYAGYTWSKRHELRLLYAPLIVNLNGRLGANTAFAGSTFAAATATSARYKFNSYRISYAYHFESSGPWQFALGFTAKIRDAEIRVSQGSTTASKANVGLVPLLNLQASRTLGDAWSLRFDLDGLAAPQGRAFDGALFLERSLAGGSDSKFSVFAGYRTIEGGASNDEVYNFAWIHKAVLGLRGEL